jgi:hypothetical protein
LNQNRDELPVYRAVAVDDEIRRRGIEVSVGPMPDDLVEIPSEGDDRGLLRRHCRWHGGESAFETRRDEDDSGDRHA